MATQQIITTAQIQKGGRINSGEHTSL